MSANALTKSVMVACSRGLTRLFRLNSGMGWTGDIVEKTPTRLVLSNPRPMRAGLSTSNGDSVKGASDLIGWTTVIITPDMVGHRVAVFTAPEIKAGRDRLRKEQVTFIKAVRKAGGIAGDVRSPEEAIALITAGPAQAANDSE